MEPRKKILLLDDDSGFLAETEQVLAEAGYEVATCQKPVKSFALIRSFRPDCMLLDIHMPLFDGRDLLPWLRRQWPLLPIVVITAVQDVSLSDFMRHNVFCILKKPFSLEMLFQAIEDSIFQTRKKYAA